MWPNILLVLNLAVQPPASLQTAESWAVIADRDDYSFRVLMDPGTVSLRENFISAWVLYDFASPQTTDSAVGGQYLSEKSLWIFDCPSGRTTMVSFIRYSRNFGEGNEIDSASAPAQASRMEFFPKDSVATDQINAVCGVWRKRHEAPILHSMSGYGPVPPSAMN